MFEVASASFVRCIHVLHHPSFDDCIECVSNANGCQSYSNGCQNNGNGCREVHTRIRTTRWWRTNRARRRGSMRHEASRARKLSTRHSPTRSSCEMIPLRVDTKQMSLARGLQTASTLTLYPKPCFQPTPTRGFQPASNPRLQTNPDSRPRRLNP